MKRPALITTAVALGLGLALSPIAANAAPADTSSVSEVASAAPAAPRDTTSYEQLEDVYYDLLFGGSGATSILVKAAPGAEVAYSVNGVAQTKQADGRGRVTFDVTFERAVNDVALSQAVNGVSSAVKTFQYDFS
ncbi:hypothetical protein C1N91_04070 [Curtobacterium sp. SGAir0471]|uniref:hypothetical protein n=1 Tax=Curtobacterium sp. SGAir0471 TaxID=2070337 RepID=UPI0010CD2504|nr:hypothetical protein [Curtobacterium sp. SGAir0471]QCR42845.1 hypothetical protein C1N91_04070 [Curtobacterium sp. SGAir0471]